MAGSNGLPEVTAIGFATPLEWLAGGWRDLWRPPSSSPMAGRCDNLRRDGDRARADGHGSAVARTAAGFAFSRR